MKLDLLRLENFRCYADLEVPLHSQLTVLVAENGQGKSTLLDAIRIALWPFVNSFDLARNAFNDPGNAIAIDDVRLLRLTSGDMARQLPARVTMSGDFGSGAVSTWVRYRDKEARATKTKDDGDTGFMRQWAGAVQDQIRDPEKPTLDLPVFGYYGTGRLWAQKRLTENLKGKDDTRETDFYVRTFAYLNCLDPASSYKHFKEWFIWAFQSLREQQIRQLEKRARVEELQAAEDRVRVVQQAIDSFLSTTTGWHQLEFSVTQESSLVLSHDLHGTLDVDQLSDGIRSVLAMIGDIAYRCIKLNPHLGGDAARQTRGVVLIDEVDMHLHPRWQQIILTQLREVFPQIQFVITTHSPQVLTSVPSECIRILKDNKVYSAPPGTEGSEPERMLRQVLGLDEVRPPASLATQELKEYLALVDRDQWSSPRALELRKKLDERYQGQEPALLDADLQIENRKWELGE
ncbi:MAG: AAA family ATPase [Pseudomonas sp.]